MKFTVTGDGTAGGKLVFTGAAVASVNADTKIEVTSNIKRLTGEKVVTFIVDTTTSDAIAKAGKIKFASNGNSFHAYTFDGLAVANSLQGKVQPNVKAGLEELAKNDARLGDYVDSSFINALGGTLTADEALDLRDTIGELPDPKEQVDYIVRFANPLKDATVAVGDAVASAVTGLGSRLASLDAAAMSSGDDCGTRYGAWATPFYGQFTQDLDGKNTPGYVSKNLGATFGFDTAMSDNTTIGAAFTALNTDVKYKNYKDGDKTKANTFLMSIYGMQKIADTNWFVKGSAGIGRSKIKGTETIGTRVNTNANSTLYVVEASGGYNYRISEPTVVTPMVGMYYNRSAETKHKRGAASSSQEAVNRFEMFGGARVSSTMELSGMNVTPEAHAFIRQAFGSINTKVTQAVNGMQNFSTAAPKSGKTTFNFGFGATVKNGNVDYSAGYDLFVASKYSGHQGTLKVRVNF